MDYLDIVIELYLHNELRSLPYLVTPQGRAMLLDTIIENKRNFIDWIFPLWFCGAIGIIYISVLIEISTEILMTWILLLLGFGSLLYGWGLIQIRYLSKLSSSILNGETDPSFYLSSSTYSTSSRRNNPRW